MPVLASLLAVLMQEEPKLRTAKIAMAVTDNSTVVAARSTTRRSV